jgi:ADP-ribosylglycohydrolase
VAEGAGLENRYTGNGIVGSNPTLSVPMQSNSPDRLAGCLVGQALGDALGFVVEAAPPEIAADYVATFLRAGRAAERRHPSFRFGQYSDDTQLARELLLTVRELGRFEPSAYAARIAELFRRGRDVGAGPGTRGAAKRLCAGVVWHEAGTPPPYAGNGAAMRAAPLGLLYRHQPSGLIRAAEAQSRITHHDPRAAAGAVAVAGAVALASRPAPLVPEQFVMELATWVEQLDSTVAVALRDLGRWSSLEPDAAVGELRRMALDLEHAGGWRGVSTLVTPSVVWSLYAFLRAPDDYMEAISTAIAVGGDTDTMAAMTGAVSGARLGLGALPRALLGTLTDQGEWGVGDLASLAYDCAAISAESAVAVGAGAG